MGNSGGKARDPGVKKRSKKKGRKEDRPVSDPTGGLPPDLQVEHSLRRAGSEDITGRYAGGGVSLSPNPLFQDNDVDQPSKSVAGSSALANEAILSQYKKRLQLILKIWPELDPLDDLDLTTLRATAIDALQTLYKLSHDEYQEEVTLSKQCVELKDYIVGLEKRCQNQDNELHRKDNQIETLDHELQILTGELRRRGIEPRLLDRGSRKLPEEPPSDYDTIPFDKPQNERKGSNGGGREERADSVAKKEEEDPYSLNKKRTTYIATPLLQAGGVKGLESAIRRSQSLRSAQAGSVPAQGGAVDQGRAPDTSRMVDDLNRKLRTLQHSLDEERRRTQSLQDLLDSAPKRTSVVDLVPNGGPTPDSLTRQYDELEGQALSRVVTSLFMIVSRVPHADVAKFLCDTMLLASENAADLYRRFQTSAHSLLTCPVNPDTGTDLSASHGKRVSGSQLRKYNQFEKGRPSSTSGSRLAQRTRANTELPKYLEEEVINFIRLTSESTNIEPLVEVVWESLTERWPECATPAVMNHSGYSDFLHQCCRLAWQLNTTLPPCYVTVDKTMRYDERYHTLVQEGMNASIGAEIDFYAWPILYRKKYGEILCRGRVNLNMRL